jgi:hypothetical protein
VIAVARTLRHPPGRCATRPSRRDRRLPAPHQIDSILGAAKLGLSDEDLEHINRGAK